MSWILIAIYVAWSIMNMLIAIFKFKVTNIGAGLTLLASFILTPVLVYLYMLAVPAKKQW